MAGSKLLDVAKLMDGSKVSPLHIRVSFLCGLTFLIDGFNTMVVGAIGPFVARELHATKPEMGQMFSAGVFGVLVGYLLISPFTGRFGQRRIMVGSVLAFAVCTLASAFATNIEMLSVLRFLTGIGLGSTLTGAIALPGEYSPKRWRATFIMIMGLGMTFGQLTPGLLTAWMVDSWHWQGILIFGAIAAFVLSAVLALFLPESLEYLVRVRQDRAAVTRIVHAIDPEAVIDADIKLTAGSDAPRQTSVLALFHERRTLGTLAFWVGFIANIMVLFFIQSWLPTIFMDQGYGQDKALILTSISLSAGFFAALISGPLMDRLGPYRVIYVVFALGALFVASIGLVADRGYLIVTTMVFGTNFCIAAVQKGFGVLGVTFYPTSLRGTGLGWGYGVARLGGVIGSYGTGVLLGWHWAPASLFYIAAIPMALGSAAIYLMYRRYAAPPSGGGFRKAIQQA